MIGVKPMPARPAFPARPRPARPLAPANGRSFPRPAGDTIDVEVGSYQPPQGSRVAGGLGTIAIVPLVVVGALMMVDRVDHRPIVQKPLALVFTPMPPALPETPTAKPREAPQARSHAVDQKPAPAMPTPIVPMPSPQAPSTIRLPVTSEIKPLVTEPAAPLPRVQADPSPPASHGPDKWEGRVIARLERFRHYPPDARKARQQGTTYLRFRIDRSGHVLASSLERSSGYPGLDEAALETLREADPLPRIPADRPDQVELIVPVEFHIGK